ncbi:hypothetical protein CF326_g9770, partial [Tilletia indica]
MAGIGGGVAGPTAQDPSTLLPPNADPIAAIQNIQAAMYRLNLQWSAVAQQPDSPSRHQTQQLIGTQIKKLQFARQAALQALSPAQQQEQLQLQQLQQQHHLQQQQQQSQQQPIITAYSKEHFVTMVRQFHQQRNSRLPTNASMSFYAPSASNPSETLALDAQTIFQ